MNKRFLALSSFLCLIMTITVSQSAHAIMTYGYDSNNYIAPTGEYASVGYRYMARVQKYDSSGNPAGLGNVAIPISQHWALQAKHIGIGAGGVINFNGSLHTIVESQWVTGTDLSLIRVDNPFSDFVYMYDPTQDGISEVMRDAVIVGGTGAQKDAGDRIYTTTPGTGERLWNGWDITGVPASEAGQLSWGRNRIEGVYNVFGTDCLYASFDQPTLPDGSPNPAYIGADEAAAYSGDSGGGMFIMQNGQWRLAGQIFAVGAVSISSTGPAGTLGPIFDARNMWYQDDNKNWVQIQDPNPVPLGMYASQVSRYRSEIDAITGETRGLGAFTVVPEAGTIPLMLAGAAGVLLGGLRLRRRK